MGRLFVIALIGVAFALAEYDAESVKRAAIDEIIGKYYAYDPFLLPPSRQARFEDYVQEAKPRYEDNTYHHKPTSEKPPPKEAIPYESTQAAQYEVRESPAVSQRYRDNFYVRARSEERARYQQAKRPSHYDGIETLRGDSNGFGSRPHPERVVPRYREQARYNDNVDPGFLLDPTNDEFYPVAEKPSTLRQNKKNSARLLVREEARQLTRASSWPSYGSAAFFADRPKNTRRAATRSARFLLHQEPDAFSEGNLLSNGRDIASKVLWRSPITSGGYQGPAVYAE